MSITKYFRDALAAQLSPQIDLNGDYTIKVKFQQVESGMIPPDEAKKLLSKESKSKSLDVLISVKTVSARVSVGTDILTDVDDLTGFFIVPAVLQYESGELSRTSKKRPWFVREFLSPTVESELCVGKEEDENKFYFENKLDYEKALSWDKYWDYVKRMYEAVTDSAIDSNSIPNLENGNMEEDCYIIPDETINATAGIRLLYEEIEGCENNTSMPLYRQFTSTASIQTRAMIENNVKTMEQHVAQMGGEYSLSPSQREALNHLNALKSGEILAVSGPPGTGKTTFLQSVTANLVTQHALEQKAPPIIVASSTNNQAVTNIIDSFGKISSKGSGNLESRWVTTVESFAVYFPSDSKSKAAKEKGYQIGKELTSVINTKSCIEESEKKMIEKCKEFFGSDIEDVEQYKSKIHHELSTVDELRRSLLNNFSKLINETKGKKVKEYIDGLHAEQIHINNNKLQFEQLVCDKQQLCEGCNVRIKEWNAAYKKLSWYIRLFPFLPINKKKILHFVNRFKRDDELLEFADDSTPNAVVKHYHSKISGIESEIYDIRFKIANLLQSIANLQREIDRIEGLMNGCYAIAKELNNCRSVKLISEGSTAATFLADKTLDDINDLLDITARYSEFWLAVHYYECMWIKDKALTEEQLNTNIDNVMRRSLQRIAMLAPMYGDDILYGTIQIQSI